jgi:two-component system response regulator YesN
LKWLSICDSINLQRVQGGRILNILIVDDEISAIEAVKNGVHWDNLAVDFVCTAMSMKEAIELLNKYQIDIMICDIEMPMGSGLELLRWVNENKSKTECIFMTCHADFAYAQQAIQLGSMDYLLKPLSYDRLEEIISKAIAKISMETVLKKNSGAWLQNKDIVLKQFWKDFFVGEISPDKESLKRYIQDKNIDIDVENDYMPVLISIKKWNEEFSREDQRLMDYSLKNISQELFVIENITKEVIEFTDDSVLIMFKFDKPLSNTDITVALKACCEKLIKVVKQYFKMFVSCYIGNPESIYMMPAQIESLQVIDFNNVTFHKEIHLLQDYKHYHIEYSNSIFDGWNELVQNNKFHRLLNEIKQTLTTEENLKKIDRNFLWNFYQDFYYILIAFSGKHNIFLNELFGENKFSKLSQAAVTSLDDLLQWVEYSIIKMKEYVEENIDIVNPIDKTKKYVEAHISEEISMEDIAKNVHLNSDYLTRIFKKEVGFSISKYIINRKMELAKDLLIKTDKAIGEVALDVGYLNYSSFNRIFTKTVEMSPQEFKSAYKK